MGQLGLCLPMAQAAIISKHEGDPIALDTDASSGKKPTYKQFIVSSSIGLVIDATMNFGFKRDIEEDDSSMCGLLHNSNMRRGSRMEMKGGCRLRVRVMWKCGLVMLNLVLLPVKDGRFRKKVEGQISWRTK
uniref:Zeta toxin domain, P-loop containing nucleoside triphosphate hydrolase n=1 Tax=Tanacetum cinerariifolium TaxID=118510 RepID=A0A699GV26_TANCI|nr:zeta toxin domain, P-loop containing nucleoside triphosphate hydrolase [Tanacetum cinerariifolium]